MQVALSVVLLSAAGLFVRHVSNLRNVDLGFQRDSVLLVTLDPAGQRLRRDSIDHAVPGAARAAAGDSWRPLRHTERRDTDRGRGRLQFRTCRRFTEKPEDRRYLSLNWVGPKYFETLGTPLDCRARLRVRGRGPPARGDRQPGDGAVLFRRRQPASASMSRSTADDKPYEIVGVAGDAKYLTLHKDAPPTVYLHSFQEGRVVSQFALRTSVPPAAVAGEVRRAVARRAEDRPWRR